MMTPRAPLRIDRHLPGGGLRHALIVAGLTLGIAGPALAAASAPVPVPVPVTPATPYFLNPCLDQNGDHVEDYLLSIPDRDCDLYVIFDANGWNPAVSGAQVAAILAAFAPTPITLDYVSSGSPYIFLGNVDFGVPRAIPAVLQEIIALPGVVGVRAYQRFILTTMTASSSIEPRPWQEVPGDVNDVDTWEVMNGGGGGTAGGLELFDAPLSTAAAPVPAHTTLIYFVDSGIDGPGAYWGIDAPTQDPAQPQRGTDPKDITKLKHGTFVKGAALQTALAELPGVPPGLIRFADVRVAVAPNGETTTLELTRAFDAILSHIKYETARGITPRIVINVSYDTDGGIANHDIIYPKVEGRVSPLGHAAGTALNGPTTRTAAAPLTAGDPCAIELFDNVYKVLSQTHSVTLVVGAGNDGQRASYVINPVGRSAFTTIVASAVEPRTGRPAAYSCFGTAPGGFAQNGHPDLAAYGTVPVPGFGYQLQGTSVSTALISGVAAARLHKNPALSTDMLVADLVSKGYAIPQISNHWYGDARVKLAGDSQGIGPAPADTGGAPGALPGLTTGVERISVDQPADGALSIQVFNVAGRLVRTLHDGPLGAGRHELAFEARDDSGAPLAGGLYFVRAAGSGGTRVAKLLLRR